MPRSWAASSVFTIGSNVVRISDAVIRDKPELVRAVVKAALRGMKDIMDDPDGAAKDFVKFVPEWQGKEAEVRSAFEYYAKHVYVGQKRLGEIDPRRLGKLQDFYLANGIIQKKTPIGDLYTNAFIE